MSKSVRKPFAVLTSAALGLSLVLTPGAATVSAETLSVTFPDVGSAHWARSHVAKLAASGIIKGYDTGEFRPSNNVTQQEAIVMAIRMIGLEDEALADNRAIALGSMFEVDGFFRPYVVKAFESRLLNLAEETAAAETSNQELIWGKRPASREWVAKMVIRAIGQTADTSSASLQFSDAGQVSASAAGFVKKAVDLGLVTGFDDNTFRPKDAVTRAQIATFLSRSDQYAPLDVERTITGVVLNRSGNTIQVQTSGGAVQSVALNANMLVFNEVGASLGMADIQPMKQVKLIHQDGTAYYAEVSNQSVQLESVTGELVALNLQTMTVDIELESGAVQTYSLAQNVSVTDAEGSGISLSQVTEGSTVRLQRLPGTSDMTSLSVTELAYNADGTGTVAAVNTEDRTLTFTTGGNTVSYKVASDAALSVKGEPAGSLAVISVGDTMEYSIRNSVIVEIDVTAPRFVTRSGELLNFADDNMTILENGTDLKAYFLANNVKVDIEGLAQSSMKDLQKGDRVQLQLNGSDNRVERITVLDRNISAISSAKILQFDPDLKYMTVQSGTELPKIYYITNRTQLLLDGEPLSKELYDVYLAQNRTVSMQVSEDELVKLEVVTKVSGTVTAINTSTRKITLLTDQNETVTLPYSLNTFIEVPRKTSTTMADLGVGTPVQVVMNSNLDAASQILVEQSFVFQLTSANPTNRQVSAKDASGANVTITLDVNSAILNRNGQSVALSSLTAGNPVVVNYAGRKVVSIQEPATVVGKVTSVNPVGNTFVVTDFSNNQRTYDTERGVNVQTGATVTQNLPNLRVNDRVQVILDAQERPYIWVAKGEERSFSSYNEARNEITLKRVRVSDTPTYPIHSNAYLHTAEGGLLSLNRLSEHDRLTIYVLDGKIIEIIK